MMAFAYYFVISQAEKWKEKENCERSNFYRLRGLQQGF